MARMSDIIAEFINCMLNDDDHKEVIIQRNELADKFNCAPSQINYVLTTRFTIEKGYVIESRRGGGGYITIKKIEYNSKSKQLDILKNTIGNSITFSSALSIVEHLLEHNIITRKEFEIIKIAINDRTLSCADEKNRVRADILKGMITVILS